MPTNSTIQPKLGVCQMCNNGKKVPLTKKMCSTHYWSDLKMKFVNKQMSKIESDMDEDVQTLIADLDILFSRWLRWSGVDKHGKCKCYTCGKRDLPSKMQAGHYIKRQHLFLRFDTRNTKIQCSDCNILKSGNLLEYARRLELETPGITEVLYQEGNLVYSFSRHELKEMIAEYSRKLDELKK